MTVRLIVALPAILLGALIIEAASQKVSFPGAKVEAKSPDGRYIVRNQDNQNPEQPANQLSSVATRNGKMLRTYRYKRHVDVLCSPDSTAFVVNDYEGSDSALPVLFAKP